ncbi:MAG: hypothetical protein IJ693_12185 [Bacteroidaceae bacterium]|nr:hypothetical protein [Bacteroidaceae bacterium]MBR1669016.1 hypothetical protein [Bacteroidaceae bacterium]
MKYLSALLLWLMLASSALAQQTKNEGKSAPVFKKSAVVKAYRGYMKEKNYGQAKKTLDEAVSNHEEAASDALFYKLEVDVLNELIGVENRKIYLKTNPDTTTYFNYMYELYGKGLVCDSLEQQGIAAKEALGKKVNPQFRSQVGHTMLTYRKNLLSAGKYYYQKKDYSHAYQFFHMYARTKSASVFSDSKGNTLVGDPDDMTDVAVLATLSAYGSENHAGVMAYLSEGLNDQNLRPQLLEIGSKSAAQLGDTIQMVELLQKGFDNYPDTEYFLMTLVRHCNDTGDYEQALQYALRMTALHPERRDYWYMAGTEQQLLQYYAEALVSFQKCVEIKADDAEAFVAIGNIHLHEAHEAYAHFNVPLSDPTYSQQRAAITQQYSDACTAFEQARRFDESNRTLWLEGLRETYFKLNRGNALKALEKYK